MKKLLGLIGTITIAGSGMAGLVGNAPTPSKTESNSLQTNKLETLNREKRNSGNENKYEYRGVYHVFYLSNDTVNNIQQNLDLGGGIASVVSIISGALVAGPPGVIIGSWGTLLFAQWKIWNASSYNNGKGIIIFAGGLLPTWIVKIESQ